MCSIELLHGDVQPRQNAGKGLQTKLRPREDVKSPLKAHRCRLVLRQKDAKRCAQSASWTIAAPTGMSHNGNCQQEGDIETVTDRVVTAVHLADIVDILQGLSCRNMSADWTLADQSW